MVLVSDVKPLRLYNNAPPPTTTTVALCSKKHFLKTSHKRKETWLKGNAQEKERKNPLQYVSYKKSRPHILRQTHPTLSFSYIVSWGLFVTVMQYNCTVHLLSLRNHCVFSKIWVHRSFPSYMEEKGRMRRSEAALVGRHAGRQIFDLCRILGEHTRNKTTEATKTFSLLIWWHGNGS